MSCNLLLSLLMKQCILCIFLIVSCFCDKRDTRSELGYARGYLSKCPGSTKPAVIPRSELKYLNFWVKGNGKGWKKYSYYEPHKLVKDPRINFKKKTMVLILGYLDSVHFPVSRVFSNEYEARGYNILVPDFQRFVTLHYNIASRLVRPVGRLIAKFLKKLTREGLHPSKVEMLGLSLGGQAASFVAKNYQQLTGRNISKITALDPAGPCFRTLGPEERLSASDADFVEVMHTNIEGYGMANRMGHVDFYVNGGEYQPSSLYLFPCDTLCSHIMEFPIWFSAIRNPDKFIAIKCDNIQQARDGKCYEREPVETNLLGLKVNKSNHGIFYLSTSWKFPFYLGKKGLDPKYSAFKFYSELNSRNNQIFYT